MAARPLLLAAFLLTSVDARAQFVDFPAENWALNEAAAGEPSVVTADATKTANRPLVPMTLLPASFANHAVGGCSSREELLTLFSTVKAAGNSKASGARFEFVTEAQQKTSADRLAELKRLEQTGKIKVERRRLTRLSTLNGRSWAAALGQPDTVAVHESLGSAVKADCSESAFVLAHELAHIEQGDWAASGQLAADLESQQASLAQITNQLYAQARRQEFVADARAIEILQAAGLDVQGGRRLLLRLEGDDTHASGLERCRALGIFGACR
jgi:Zn-dependent protease with chaperone function